MGATHLTVARRRGPDPRVGDPTSGASRLGINGNRIIRGQWKIQIHLYRIIRGQWTIRHGMRACAGPFTAVQNHLVIGLVFAEDQQVCL
jgi:hypothetical protein